MLEEKAIEKLNELRRWNVANKPEFTFVPLVKELELNKSDVILEMEMPELLGVTKIKIFEVDDYYHNKGYLVREEFFYDELITPAWEKYINEYIFDNLGEAIEKYIDPVIKVIY